MVLNSTENAVATSRETATADLAMRGWTRIAGLAGVAEWAAAALPLARAAIADSDEPWRCGGTWFAGVDALANAPDGSVAAVPLPSALTALLPWQPPDWHRAQVSTLRPGYPQPWPGETEAAFGYRLRRDAAHVDGLLPEGPDRRRHLREPHAFILGLPLTEADAGAAPLVVWEGSHAVIRRVLADVLSPHPPQDWPGVDLTEAYHAARRTVFATCVRVELPARPGEALLLHRMVLHGMAPWAGGARAAAEGRMIAYLRPEFSEITDWLADDLANGMAGDPA
jgi:hypothetical protein